MAQHSFHSAGNLPYLKKEKHFRNLKLKSSLFVFFCIGWVVSCQNPTPKKVKTVDIRFKKEAEVSIINEANETIAPYDVEIADTPYERQTGLMYREDLQKPRHALCF
jgi:hypothetical protein